MDKIRIRGGNPLNGVVPIAGAKNAALPLLTASLLTDDTLTLSNLPGVADIKTMIQLLQHHGVSAQPLQNGAGQVSLSAASVNDTTAPYDLVRRMRASILVLAPLVARAQAAFGVLCAARRAETILSGGAAGLVERGVARLAVSGGETSGAVATALDIATVRCLPDEGFGGGICVAEAPRPLSLYFKSGKLGDDGVMLQALAAMCH